MSLISGPYVVVGDEENFLAYEERVVHEMQKILRTKEGMIHFAVLDLCARLEDLIYNDIMKQFHLSSAATGVWSKREAIDSYVLKCDVLLRGMESKPMNWKKIFEDNTHNTKGIYDAIVKEEKERKPKGGSTGDAARDSTSKSNRSRKQGTGAKGGKARSAKGKTAPFSNSDAFPAYSVGASLDDVAGQMMYAPPLSHAAAVPVPDMLLDPEGALHDDNFPDFGFDFSESNGYL